MNTLINCLKTMGPFSLSLNIIVIGLTLSLSNITHAKTFTFEYKTSKNQTLKIEKSASNKDSAFKMAARDCFSQLTGGKYPGESKGLEIIDICANPKN